MIIIVLMERLESQTEKHLSDESRASRKTAPEHTIHIQYTKEKAINRNKTIKSIKHLHIIIAAKMFPKIFFDQIFRRRNEIELTVDSVFLNYANDAVFTTISKCTKSKIVTIEHSQPEDDSIR